MFDLNKVALAVATAVTLGSPPVYVNYVSGNIARKEAERVETKIQRDVDQKFELLRADIRDLKEETKQVRDFLIKGA